jgi:hypothetical protein
MFVLLAGPRAAIGAYVIVVGLLLAARGSLRSNVVIGICAVAVTLAMVAAAGFEEFRAIWLDRGISYRDVVWAQVWAQFRDCNPLIGCGIGSPLSVTFGAVSSSRPHSLLLGVLYYQGVLGMLAFVGALGYLVISALKQARPGAIDRQDWVVMIGFALLANLTSGDHILVRSTLFWSYFWLPILVIAALRSGASNSGGATGKENSR